MEPNAGAGVSEDEYVARERAAATVCGGLRTHAEYGDTIVNPSIVVEVLSPSTEAYDRGVELAHYRTIPSLREYVLVSQAETMIEHYAREGESWRLTTWTRPTDAVPLPSVGVALPIAEVYAKIELLDEAPQAAADLPRPKALR